MKIISKIIIFVILLFGNSYANARVVFNEVMQSNINVLLVENDFPDSWVELYNDSDTDVLLEGWSIGIDDDYASAYKIPLSLIEANGYMLILCDKEDRGLHTDFRIDSGKCSLQLYDGEGNKVDELKLQKMLAPNVSYGRIDDGDQWGCLLNSSPGGHNDMNSSTELLPNADFSSPGGVYCAPLYVNVSIPQAVDDGSTLLCITTNGEEPTIKDKVEGTETTFFIESTTVLRVKLISDKRISNISRVETYILDQHPAHMPIISLTTDSLYLYSDEIGIFATGKGSTPNYMQSWRRPLNVEIYNVTENGSPVNQLCELNVMGGHETRPFAQKSVNLRANKRFGTKRFDVTGLWALKPGIKQVKSFSLRNGGQDFPYARIRDAFMQNVSGENLPNLDWQDCRYAVVYINGVYKGLYDMRERSNEDFIDANYDGLDDFDMVENGVELQNGTMDNWRYVMDRINADDITYEDAAQLIDIPQLIDYMLPHIYGGNIDFMHNNNVMWRNNTPNADNRWRWILKDLDFTAFHFTKYNKSPYETINNLFGRYNEEQKYRTHIFQLILQWPETNHILATRLAIALGSFYAVDNLQEKIQIFKNLIMEEYGHHLSVYFDDPAGQYETWEDQISYLEDWVASRNDVLYNYTSDYFKLGTPIPLVVNSADDNAPISFNGLMIKNGAFRGKYFADEYINISLADGKTANWTIKENGDIVKNAVGESVEYQMPSSAENIEIVYEVYGDGIIAPELRIGGDQPVAIYDIYGRKLVQSQSLSGIHLPSGLYIVKTPTEASTFYVP